MSTQEEPSAGPGLSLTVLLLPSPKKRLCPLLHVGDRAAAMRQPPAAGAVLPEAGFVPRGSTNMFC